MPKKKTSEAAPSLSVLVFTPLMRELPAAIAAREALLAAAPCPVEFVADTEQAYPPPDQRNVLHAYERARERLLEGSHTHLLCLEDDIIPPPDTIARLLEVDADVAYGLYVWRRSSHPWSAYRFVYTDSGISWSEDQPQTAGAWYSQGAIIQTNGLGLGCTLIRRSVMEAIRWRLFNPTGEGPANDWSFAVDCQTHKLRQVHHFGLVCGHMLPDGRTVYPGLNAMGWASHRYEEPV